MRGRFDAVGPRSPRAGLLREAVRLVGTMKRNRLVGRMLSVAGSRDALAEFTKALSVARNQRLERADGRFPTRYLAGWRRIGLASTQLVERRQMRARAFAVAAPRGQPRDRRQPGRGRQAARSGWSVAGGPMLLATVIVGAVAAGLLPLPESVAAAWSRSSDRTIERIEPQGLEEVRARLERRRELQRALRDQARALAAEVDALERRRDQISDMLQSARQHALSLERRLDYLVPRLLAREAEVRARRARTAQALAELAAKSRRVRLELDGARPNAGDRPPHAGATAQRREQPGVGPAPGAGDATVRADRAQPVRPDDGAARRVRRSGANAPAAAGRAGAAARAGRGRAASGRAAGAPGRSIPATPRPLSPAPAEPRPDRGARLDLAGRARPLWQRCGRPLLAAGAGGRVCAGANEAPERRLRAVRMPQAEHRSASQVLAAAPAAADLAGPASLAGEAGWPAMALATRPLTSTLRSERPQIWPGASHHAISRAAPLDVAFAPPRRLPAMAVAGGATPLLLPVTEALRGRSATGAVIPRSRSPPRPVRGSRRRWMARLCSPIASRAMGCS